MMTLSVSQKNPFRVLRAVPVNRRDDKDQGFVFARLDLIHRDYRLLLFDCELRHDDEVAEAYVYLPDQTPLLRYYLEPDFPGELDFFTILHQLDSAACDFFGLTAYDRPRDHVLYDFLKSAGWSQWVASHSVVSVRLPSLNPRNLLFLRLARSFRTARSDVFWHEFWHKFRLLGWFPKTGRATRPQGPLHENEALIS